MIISTIDAALPFAVGQWPTLLFEVKLDDFSIQDLFGPILMQI